MLVEDELTPTPAISGMAFPMFSLLHSIANKAETRCGGVKRNVAKLPVGHAGLISMPSAEKALGFSFGGRRRQDVIGKKDRRGKVSLSPLPKAE